MWGRLEPHGWHSVCRRCGLSVMCRVGVTFVRRLWPSPHVHRRWRQLMGVVAHAHTSTRTAMMYGRLPLFCHIAMVSEDSTVKLLLAPCSCCGGSVLCGRRLCSHCHSEASNYLRWERCIPHCPIYVSCEGLKQWGHGAPSCQTRLSYLRRRSTIHGFMRLGESHARHVDASASNALGHH